MTGKERAPKPGEHWEDTAGHIERTEVVIVRVRADDVIVCRQHQREDWNIEVTYDIGEFMERFQFKCEAEPFTREKSGRHLSYREYLASEHWKTVRADALRRAENACQLCKFRRTLQVHHNTYARLWRERPADEVIILNVGGYIGDSTRKELEYAQRCGKSIRFLEAYIR